MSRKTTEDLRATLHESHDLRERDELSDRPQRTNPRAPGEKRAIFC